MVDEQLQDIHYLILCFVQGIHSALRIRITCIAKAEN
jgi:hypothetical protein